MAESFNRACMCASGKLAGQLKRSMVSNEMILSLENEFLEIMYI